MTIISKSIYPLYPSIKLEENSKAITYKFRTYFTWSEYKEFTPTDGLLI
jgi:hypothetical protein